MTHFTERNLTQTAIYWGNPVDDGYGAYTYDTPVEISCRWEDVNMVDTVDPKVVGYVVRCEVILDQDVDENGMMFLGGLADISESDYGDPAGLGAYPIVRFDKIPTVDGKHFFRKAYLGRLWTGKI